MTKILSSQKLTMQKKHGNFILSKTLPHPTIFIFGAGASRGGLEYRGVPYPPVDNDFFDIANQIRFHGTPKLARRVLDTVFNLYKRTTGISLEACYRDIETRGDIGRFCKTSNNPMNWSRRKKNLEELIRRIFIQTIGEEKETNRRKVSVIHQNILSLLGEGDTILTFNYDLLIEESFKSAKLWNPVNGYGLKISQEPKDWCRAWLKNRNNSSLTKSKILLLKLHGSLNWILHHNGRVSLKPRPYVVRTNRYGNPVFEKVAIIAPGWNKRIDESPFNKLWQLARLKLEKCKSIVIFGYSLPENDFLAKSFFSEVARTREARKDFLKELYIADPNPQVKERFIKLFTSALSSHGKVFQYKSIEDFHSNLLK